jgi:hypothetical protein
MLIPRRARFGVDRGGGLSRHRPSRLRPHPPPGEEVAQFRNALECRHDGAELAADELGLVALLASPKSAFAYGAAAPPSLHRLGPRAPGYTAWRLEMTLAVIAAFAAARLTASFGACARRHSEAADPPLPGHLGKARTPHRAPWRGQPSRLPGCP